MSEEQLLNMVIKSLSAYVDALVSIIPADRLEEFNKILEEKIIEQT